MDVALLNEALATATLRCYRHGGTRDINYGVWAAPPETSGWMEWLIVMNSDEQGGYVPNQSMTVAMIRRTPDSQFEFHS